MGPFTRFLSVVLFLFSLSLKAQTTSVLTSGKWFKISVSNSGVFKMDYTFLKNLGLNPDDIDPHKIKMYASGNAMLPQLNSAFRISDLQEIAITVIGESDSKFNSEDYLLFYGQDPDNVYYDVNKKIFSYTNNLYSDKNYYFITMGTDNGKRLSTIANGTTSSPTVSQFDDYGYYENDTYNILSSGRSWFGFQFDQKTELTVRFDISGVVDNTNMKVVSNVMAQAFDGASFNVFLNDVQIGQQPIDPIPNTSYGLKGREKLDTLSFNSSTVSASSRSNQDIKYQYVKTGTSRSIGYLDYLLVSFKRTLALYGNQTIFRSSESVTKANSSFEISATTADAIVWDVTDPFNTKIQGVNFTNSKISFSTSTTTLKTFVVFKTEGLIAPTSEGTVDNQNLHGITSVDFIIVTNALFKTEAQRLADHRTSHDNLAVSVVTTDQIYNEYSGGKQDITAIRDFTKDVYNKSNKRLSNVLLFGRCSYDYKDIGEGNSNYVPTYESVNSLSPLETYSSDDYFTFLEPSEGEWTEYPALDHSMDIGIGRFSVRSVEEAQNVVDKLISYDNPQITAGAWQKTVVFVADDGDYNLHVSQADALASTLESKFPEFNANKIYLDAYKQVATSIGQFSPNCKAAISKAVYDGAIIINYTGHGSEDLWMQEQVLSGDEITTWKNEPRYPLFVTATCEFGRHDNPYLISSGEKIQIQKNGGGIGLVTTSRPVYSSTNFTINQALYDALFVRVNGKFRSLGTIFMETKNNSISGISNRNFSLLGDPSMKIGFAENQAILNSIKTTSNSDTLKALSTVKVAGEIKSGSQRLTNFSGTIEVTLFDKLDSLKTLGDENPLFSYVARDNTLFKGKASVTNGTFQFECTIPKNIDATVGNAKLGLFATSVDGLEASGGTTSIKLGKAEAGTGDTTPPDIALFMGDTSYVSGGLVGPNATLVAQLKDLNGINLSARIASKSLQATLDDTLTYVVNNYYVADKDTYKSGIVSFPLQGLIRGKHTITFSASDTYNNTATSSIDFVVTDGDGIVIDQFYNYPNPFNPNQETATLQFVHSRPGDDLEAQLQLFDITGQTIDLKQFSITASAYRVILTEWNGTGANGNKLPSGIYLARLSVRSLVDGSKNEQSTRLIILN